MDLCAEGKGTGRATDEMRKSAAYQVPLREDKSKQHFRELVPTLFVINIEGRPRYCIFHKL